MKTLMNNVKELESFCWQFYENANVSLVGDEYEGTYTFSIEIEKQGPGFFNVKELPNFLGSDYSWIIEDDGKLENYSILLSSSFSESRLNSNLILDFAVHSDKSIYEDKSKLKIVAKFNSEEDGFDAFNSLYLDIKNIINNIEYIPDLNIEFSNHDPDVDKIINEYTNKVLELDERSITMPNLESMYYDLPAILTAWSKMRTPGMLFIVSENKFIVFK